MTMDRDKMTEGIRIFVEGIGERFEGDDLDRTPKRVARAWAEDLIAGYGSDAERELTWSPAPEGTGLVLVRDIGFASVCVHHLLPFVGVANVAYLPGARLAGLSKIGRVVEAHARRLQIQERLTSAILGTLTDVLEPRGALVQLEALHTCMTLRGARKERSRLVTMSASGLFENDSGARREILDLLAANVSSPTSR
jgi:GTP cyclohydrolase I